MFPPAGVLAFLWPVTDGDVDRMAARVLRYWVGHLFDGDVLATLPDAVAEAPPPAATRPGISLSAAVALARADAHAGLCRTPYLTASGCIVLGDAATAFSSSEHSGGSLKEREEGN